MAAECRKCFKNLSHCRYCRGEVAEVASGFRHLHHLRRHRLHLSGPPARQALAIDEPCAIPPGPWPGDGDRLQDRERIQA